MFSIMLFFSIFDIEFYVLIYENEYIHTIYQKNIFSFLSLLKKSIIRSIILGLGSSATYLYIFVIICAFGTVTIYIPLLFQMWRRILRRTEISYLSIGPENIGPSTKMKVINPRNSLYF